MIEPVYVYRAAVREVVDGDTYVLDIDLGFKVAAAIPVRLHGFNCPELSTEEGQAAATFARGLLPIGGAVIVQTYKGPRSGKDVMSFARYVADVWLSDGRSLGGVLQDAGMAMVMG